MTIGSNIKKLRTGKKLTQDQLAEKLYVTRQTVSNWERGTSQPDLEQLEAIAAALEVDVTTLLYGPKPKAGPSRKRIVTAVVLVVLTCVLWCLGKFVLAPWIREITSRTYIMDTALLYRFCYQPLVLVLGSCGLMTLASLVWDISLPKQSRQVCLGVGIVMVVCTAVMLVPYSGVYLENELVARIIFQAELYYAGKHGNLVITAIGSIAFFLAFNPPRKQTSQN